MLNLFFKKICKDGGTNKNASAACCTKDTFPYAFSPSPSQFLSILISFSFHHDPSWVEISFHCMPPWHLCKTKFSGIEFKNKSTYVPRVIFGTVETHFSLNNEHSKQSHQLNESKTISFMITEKRFSIYNDCSEIVLRMDERKHFHPVFGNNDFLSLPAVLPTYNNTSIQ